MRNVEAGPAQPMMCLQAEPIQTQVAAGANAVRFHLK